MHFNVCSYHVTYMLQSESTLYTCLDVKDLVAKSSRYIWSLSDCKGTRTKNRLVHKRTLNRLTKLAQWLSCVVSTYLYGAFDCVFLPCHVRVSEWIHTLEIPECQETACSKQAQYLRLSNCNRTRIHNHLVHTRTLNALVKLAKWLSCVVTTYFYDAFDCVFLSCRTRLSEWILTP